MKNNDALMERCHELGTLSAHGAFRLGYTAYVRD